MSLSVFDLRKLGYFSSPTKSGVMRWYLGERPMGSVHLFSHQGEWLRCSYQYENDDRSLSLTLIKTRCFFGGIRFWLSCPQCKRRVAILYLHGGNVRCRLCHGLGYRSSQTTHVGHVGALIRFLQLDNRAEDQYLDRRSKYWKGRLTKHHQRWLSRRIKMKQAGKAVVDRLAGHGY